MLYDLFGAGAGEGDGGLFNLFRYITFRAGGAFFTALLFGFIFGKPIIDFQGVGFMLADMAIQTETSRLLVNKAAWLRDNGRPYADVAAMAKCRATDASVAVATDAVQVLGGYGYRSYPRYGGYSYGSYGGYGGAYY